ncbi:3-keto-5-aminohexanoate cleavage protein [Sulfitobacter porphyrae]|uniref:3-keto-5-aminohexanoate cleavage protein n=1 Tax=Sulfitobacter porphyrae TaxID=1246864 RepID=A0ABW2BAI7_9RHOB
MTRQQPQEGLSHDTPLHNGRPERGRRSRADHPALPVTTDQIAATALACANAGADALHLHVRDDDGRHSLDAGRYREALAEIAVRAPALRLQITTEAGGIFDVADQLACLKAVKPGWASISVREIARDPALAAQVYGTCADLGTEVQHILYDTDDIALLNRWQAEGIVQPDQTEVIFVLGRYTPGQVSSPTICNLSVTPCQRLRDGWSAPLAARNTPACWPQPAQAARCAWGSKTA